MQTTWNNKIGSRERKAILLLVTFQGEIHQFQGKDIPGICKATEVAYEKSGKWSNTTYRIDHHETTTPISFRQDWDRGYAFPQTTWEEGLLFILKHAPSTMEKFESFIRTNYPGAAKRWDEVRDADNFFNIPMTALEIEKLEQMRADAAAEVERLQKLEDGRKAKVEARMREIRENSPFAVLQNLKVK